jgi:hypothetical protein
MFLYLRVKSLYECREAEYGRDLCRQEGCDGEKERPSVSVLGIDKSPGLLVVRVEGGDRGPDGWLVLALVDQEDDKHNERAAEDETCKKSKIGFMIALHEMTQHDLRPLLLWRLHDIAV